MSPKKLTPNEITLSVRFAEHLFDPQRWLDKAEELLAAAKQLEPKIQELWEFYFTHSGNTARAPEPPDLQGVYFMLMAYSIENMCKAALVQKHQRAYRNKIIIKLPDFLKGHDLVQLFKRIGLACDVQEEDLLIRLCMNSTWAGRYPVPMESGGIRGAKRFSDGETRLTGYYGQHDVQRLNQLVNRLRIRLGQAV